MKKFFSFLIVIMIVFSFINVTIFAKNEEFEFSTWGDISFFEDGFHRMQAIYPEYKDIIFKGEKVGDDNIILMQRLISSAAAGSFNSMPDMIELCTDDIQVLAGAGLLLDLTDKMKPYKDYISPAVWEGITYNGRVYAVPYMANSSMIWYRKDVFDMAGVKADAIKTWDDFIEAGKKITNFNYPDGKKRYMVEVGATEIGRMPLQLMLGQQGIGLFDQETGETTVGNDPRFRKAFETYAQFAEEGISLKVDGWTAPWYESLADGTLVCYISANWMDQVVQTSLSGDQKNKWRVMKLPAFEIGGKRAALESGSANVAILNIPKVNYDLAWAYIESSFLNKNIFSDLYINHHLVPAYLPALDDPLFNKPNEFYGGQNIGQLDIEIQKEAGYFPFTKHYAEAVRYVTDQLHYVMQGKKSVDEGIKDAASCINTQIDVAK